MCSPTEKYDLHPHTHLSGISVNLLISTNFGVLVHVAKVSVGDVAKQKNVRGGVG